jgi:hypothetical protein
MDIDTDTDKWTGTLKPTCLKIPALAIYPYNYGPFFHVISLSQVTLNLVSQVTRDWP